MNSIFYDFKKYKHRYYKDKKGLYYVYIHLYDNKPVYVGKGSTYRVVCFSTRCEKYLDFVNNVGSKNIEKYIIAESYDEKLMLDLETLIHEELLDRGHSLYSSTVRGKYEIKNKPIVQLDLDGNFISNYESATIASKKLCINRGGIVSCLTGRQNTSFGCRWEYASKYY